MALLHFVQCNMYSGHNQKLLFLILHLTQNQNFWSFKKLIYIYFMVKWSFKPIHSTHWVIKNLKLLLGNNLNLFCKQHCWIMEIFSWKPGLTSNEHNLSFQHLKPSTSSTPLAIGKMVRLDRFPRRNNTHVNRHQAGQTSWQQWVHEQCPGWHMDRGDHTTAGVGNEMGFHVVVQRSGNLVFHVCNPENLPACP